MVQMSRHISALAAEAVPTIVLDAMTATMTSLAKSLRYMLVTVPGSRRGPFGSRP
jgi:hypothetical protein